MAILTANSLAKTDNVVVDDVTAGQGRPPSHGIFITLEEQAKAKDKPTTAPRSQKNGSPKLSRAEISARNKRDVFIAFILLFVIITALGLAFVVITGHGPTLFFGYHFYGRHGMQQGRGYSNVVTPNIHASNCFPGFVPNKGPQPQPVDPPGQPKSQCIHERVFKTKLGVKRVIHDFGNRMSALICTKRCLLFDMSEIEGGCCPFHYPYSLDERVGVSVLTGPLGQVVMGEPIRAVLTYRCMGSVCRNISFAGQAIGEACSGKSSFKVSTYGVRYKVGFRQIPASRINVALQNLDPNHSPTGLTRGYRNSVQLFRDPHLLTAGRRSQVSRKVIHASKNLFNTASRNTHARDRADHAIEESVKRLGILVVGISHAKPDHHDLTNQLGLGLRSGGDDSRNLTATSSNSEEMPDGKLEAENNNKDRKTMDDDDGLLAEDVRFDHRRNRERFKNDRNFNKLKTKLEAQTSESQKKVKEGGDVLSGKHNEDKKKTSDLSDINRKLLSFRDVPRGTNMEPSPPRQGAQYGIDDQARKAKRWIGEDLLAHLKDFHKKASEGASDLLEKLPVDSVKEKAKEAISNIIESMPEDHKDSIRENIVKPITGALEKIKSYPAVSYAKEDIKND